MTLYLLHLWFNLLMGSSGQCPPEFFYAPLHKLIQHKDVTDDLLPTWSQSISDANPVRLHFNNVGFRYEGEDNKWVLKNIYLTLDLSQHVSLIGKVGSGKSILLKLIRAEINPVAGTIQVDAGVVSHALSPGG